MNQQPNAQAQQRSSTVSALNPALPVPKPSRLSQPQGAGGSGAGGQQGQQQRNSPSPQPPSPRTVRQQQQQQQRQQRQQQQPQQQYQQQPQAQQTQRVGAEMSAAAAYSATSQQQQQQFQQQQAQQRQYHQQQQQPSQQQPQSSVDQNAAASARRQSEIAWQQQQLQQQQQQQFAQAHKNFATLNSSTATTYGKSSSSNPLGLPHREDPRSDEQSVPDWGPNGVLFPPAAAAAAAAVPTRAPVVSLASLYQRSSSSSSSSASSSSSSTAVVPFAPPPRPAQNLCDTDSQFFELYKAVWASGFHPIHDGIERPAVMALLPPKSQWLNRRFLDIGCGAGKLCRIFRGGLAKQVVGVDASLHMISVARSKAEKDEAYAAAAAGEKSATGNKGVGSMLKKLFFKDGDDAAADDKAKQMARRQQQTRDEQQQRSSISSHQGDSSRNLLAGSAGMDADAQQQQRGSFSFSKLFRKESRPSLKSSADDFDVRRLQRDERRISASDVAGGGSSSSGRQSPMMSPSSVAGREMEEPLSSASSTSASPPPAMTITGPVLQPRMPPIQFIHSTFEDWEASERAKNTGTNSDLYIGGPVQFDCITCCMTLQFIWDLRAFALKCASLLAPNGLLVLSVDHPVATASWGIHPIVVKSERNPSEILYFPLDAYADEGERTAKYYVEGVRKYHRTVSTYINSFLAAGLMLERIVEPRASTEIEARHPELKIWRRKPIFLCLRFRKPKNNDF